MDKPSPQEIFSQPRTRTLTAAPPETNYEDAEVQFKQGLKFASGAGAARDYVQAAEWYRKAAQQNHSLAQFNLGVMYAEGQGVARDVAQSRVWYGKAAQLGDAGAQFSMGNSCHQASFRQVPSDASESRIEAYKWYRLAAAQAYQGSEMAYASLTLNMTRADIAAGKRRVNAFKKGRPKSGG